jgi:predicted permease
MSIIGFVDSVGRDLRYSLRGLVRRPAFTLAAVVTLALGIGATTAIFSVVYSVLVKPLPYPNADELVSIRPAAPGINTNDLGSDVTMYLTYRDENRTFASIGMWDERSATVTDGGEPERVPALRVADGTLQALGVRPMRGRWFTEQEAFGPAGESLEPVILSYGFWQRRFGGDEAVLGRELTMEAPRYAQAAGVRWRVVGIMPRGFRFLDRAPQPDVIVPLRIDPVREGIGNFSFNMLARLRPGATPADAYADVERMLPLWLDEWQASLSGSLTREVIEQSWQITPGVRPLKDDLVRSVASALWVLMGAIGAVLLIACANVANLLLVRADARRQELAVRSALGAGTKRIARELLVESLVLGAAGGVVGCVLAYLGVQALVAIGPNDLPRLEEIAVHPPVLAFSFGVTLASTLVFGSITALKHALRVDTPSSGLARGSSATRERSTTRSVLVVVQVALALVLVVSAGLMIRSFQALREVDPGFTEPATIQTARIWIPPALYRDAEQAFKPEQVTRLWHEILDRIAAIPGVASVGFTDDVPMEMQWDNRTTVVEGEPIAAGATPPFRRWNYVSPGYFEAMGTRMIAGRDVTWSDMETGRRVAVISENLARALAPEPAAAIGRRIRGEFQTEWHDVIGVVQSVHLDGLHEDPPNTVYWPALAANTRGDVTFAIRSERAGAASLANDVRQAVRSVNGSIPITLEGTMRDLYSVSLARTSFTLVLLAIAGAMAVALGVVGIYGVIAYGVSQRTREIGIRAALGAEPRQLAKMFLQHGMALSAVGVVVGLAAAAASGRAMSSLLFGVEPLDLVAYVTAIAVILAAAALATYMPARRAANIDPIETLRAE